MKLSEAIRLGSSLKPQARGRLSLEGHSCALGAAIDGTFENAQEIFQGSHPYSVLKERYPILNSEVKCLGCKESKNYRDSLLWIIIHLNDVHGWTREAIADFVEAFETRQEKNQCNEPSCSTLVNDQEAVVYHSS